MRHDDGVAERRGLVVLAAHHHFEQSSSLLLGKSLALDERLDELIDGASQIFGLQIDDDGCVLEKTPHIGIEPDLAFGSELSSGLSPALADAAGTRYLVSAQEYGAGGAAVTEPLCAGQHNMLTRRVLRFRSSHAEFGARHSPKANLPTNESKSSTSPAGQRRYRRSTSGTAEYPSTLSNGVVASTQVS